MKRGITAAALLACASLAGCEEDGPQTVELHGLVVTVPDGWAFQTAFDGPKYTLTLSPPQRDAACQIVVIRDGRYFRDDDARALLGDGRAVFGGRPAGELTIDTEEGPLEGFVHADPEPQPSWRVRPPGGPSRVEMVAAERGIHLIAAVIVTWERSRDASSHREACVAAIRGMR